MEQFPQFIFPEISELPLYIRDLVIRPEMKREGSKFGLSAVFDKFRNEKPLPEVQDKDYDLNYLRALWKELLRNRTISQYDKVLTFFKLNNIFSAIASGELAFVRYFLDQRKDNLNSLNEEGTLSPLQFAVVKGFKNIVEVKKKRK